MLNSSFDMEIHAKTYQDNALRNAQKARLIDEARSRGQVSRFSVGVSISQLFAAVRERFARVGPVTLAPAMDDPGVPDFSMLVVADERRGTSRARPARAAEPYAAMVVLARSANVPVAGQPCEVRDC